MIKKITEKDKKDWFDFLNNNEKLINKDNQKNQNQNQIIDKVIDLHGYSLENANKTINEFIKICFSQKISKINVITGKGSRSKNIEDPYKSKDLSILKFSVPDYIKSKNHLMKIIKEINYSQIDDSSSGSFDILLKNIKV